MACKFLYDGKDGKPSCPFLDCEQCSFQWWCTHDHIWKAYNGEEHCGLRGKKHFDGWFGVVSVNKDNTITLANSKREDTITVPCSYNFTGKPIAIKCPAANYDVIDVIYE